MAQTLIFSDTHLSCAFEPDRFSTLQDIISKADRVIINGDFWEGYLTTLEEFVESPWKQLFPLLKARNAFYVYGNHDKEKFCDPRVNLFSTLQGYECRVPIGDKILRIEHGNRIIPDYDDADWYPRSYTIGWLRDRIFRFVVTRFGREPIHKVFHKMNDRIKQWANHNLAENEILVCGHTHQCEFNLAEKFIDTGFIDCGYATYVRVNGDRIELVQERY